MGFQATNAGGLGLIPGQGTKIPLAATKSLHDAINIQKKKKKRKYEYSVSEVAARIK